MNILNELLMIIFVYDVLDCLLQCCYFFFVMYIDNVYIDDNINKKIHWMKSNTLKIVHKRRASKHHT